MPSALDGFSRFLNIQQATSIHADFEYGSTVDRQAIGQPHTVVPSTVTIHKYCPKQHLGIFLKSLNFDREQTEGYIAAGYNDTLQHDCEAEGCILAT